MIEIDLTSNTHDLENSIITLGGVMIEFVVGPVSARTRTPRPTFRSARGAGEIAADELKRR